MIEVIGKLKAMLQWCDRRSFNEINGIIQILEKELANNKESLEIEYGNLLQQLENNFDWIEISKLTAKLNAINCLLEVSLIESKTLYNILKR